MVFTENRRSSHRCHKPANPHQPALVPSPVILYDVPTQRGDWMHRITGLLIAISTLLWTPEANAGKYHEVKYKSQAKLKIYFVDYPSQADCLI